MGSRRLDSLLVLEWRDFKHRLTETRYVDFLRLLLFHLQAGAGHQCQVTSLLGSLDSAFLTLAASSSYIRTCRKDGSRKSY